MRLSYRCRRCQKLFFHEQEVDLPKGEALEALVDITSHHQTSKHGFRATTVHACNEHAYGIADLQGAA